MDGGSDSPRGDYMHQWSHIQYTHLIRSTRDFIVFIAADGKLDWETSTEYDSAPPPSPAEHNFVLGHAALLEERPGRDLGKTTTAQFKRLVGEAIVLALEYDYANARQMLVAAGHYLRDRCEEKSRLWYLSASLFATLIATLLGMIAWLWRDELIPLTGPTALWLWLSCVAGALGALLSVIQRSGTLKFDCSAGEPLHHLEGATRIIAGMISGLMVALAIKYELIFTALSKGGAMHGAMLFLSMIAGTGERLVKSIISDYDSLQIEVLTDEKSSTKAKVSTPDHTG